jgi:hypothetical protein
MPVQSAKNRFAINSPMPAQPQRIHDVPRAQKIRAARARAPEQRAKENSKFEDEFDSQSGQEYFRNESGYAWSW